MSLRLTAGLAAAAAAGLLLRPSLSSGGLNFLHWAAPGLEGHAVTRAPASPPPVVLLGASECLKKHFSLTQGLGPELERRLGGARVYNLCTGGGNAATAYAALKLLEGRPLSLVVYVSNPRERRILPRRSRLALSRLELLEGAVSPEAHAQLARRASGLSRLALELRWRAARPALAPFLALDAMGGLQSRLYGAVRSMERGHTQLAYTLMGQDAFQLTEEETGVLIEKTAALARASGARFVRVLPPRPPGNPGIRRPARVETLDHSLLLKDMPGAFEDEIHLGPAGAAAWAQRLAADLRGEP